MRTEKECKCCGKMLPLSEFYLNKKNKDGKTTYCKECSKLKSRSYSGTHRVVTPEGYKYCSHCKSIKPLSEFYLHSGKPSGYCKECVRIISREQRDFAREHGIKDKCYRFNEGYRERQKKKCLEAYYQKRYGMTRDEYRKIKYEIRTL